MHCWVQHSPHSPQKGGRRGSLQTAVTQMRICPHERKGCVGQNDLSSADAIGSHHSAASRIGSLCNSPSRCVAHYHLP